MNQNSQTSIFHDKFHGTILGLAVGDALGMPLEFKDPGSFQPVNV